MTPQTSLNQLEEWHKNGMHKQIAETLLALPENELDYQLTSLLARALNNLSQYEEALHLLESIREQGQNDSSWHFRMGYSLFYINGREVESIPYFERAIELGDDYPSTYELLLYAKSYLENDSSSSEETIENRDEMSFTPKSYAQLSLNMCLQPEHRGSYIEDALDFMLRSKGWGCVSGGGTLVSSEGEPEACDIEIDLVEHSEEMQKNLQTIAQKLEVAKGSKLKYGPVKEDPETFEYDVEYSTGNLEGIAIYINGTDLPDEVYENNDITEVLNELLDILSNNGALMHSYWEGPRETALYFYGEGGFNAMLEKVTPFLNEHPLCQKSRTIRIA